MLPRSNREIGIICVRCSDTWTVGCQGYLSEGRHHGKLNPGECERPWQVKVGCLVRMIGCCISGTNRMQRNRIWVEISAEAARTGLAVHTVAHTCSTNKEPILKAKCICLLMYLHKNNRNHEYWVVSLK